MARILEQIEHVVVLMLENRSFDNLLGWLYTEADPPKHNIPFEEHPNYNGLLPKTYWNRLDDSPHKVFATEGTDGDFCVPHPDPNEHFKHMNRQIFGTEDPEPCQPATMSGFVADYATAKDSCKKHAPQIMKTYSPKQLTAMSLLARAYAVSDAWFASSPTQTWPNRAFMHAGTSLGHVNNFPNIPYDCTTIYNVLEECGVEWGVYRSSGIIPSLTRIQMVKLWDRCLDGHFHTINRFCDDAATGRLPAYSFVEPLFVVESKKGATSEHPPSDVCAGDHFLNTIYQALRNGPKWNETLLIVTLDEHGGCYDHVGPTWNAVPPDDRSDPGDEGFCFNRFGVRIPTILASAYIEPSTVFRSCRPDQDEPRHPFSDACTPYDHTSILATVLDWKEIPRDKLPSARVATAPTFGDVLTLPNPRTDHPDIAATCTPTPRKKLPDDPPTDLQQSIVVAAAHYRSGEVLERDVGLRALDGITTQADIYRHFRSHLSWWERILRFLARIFHIPVFWRWSDECRPRHRRR